MAEASGPAPVGDPPATRQPGRPPRPARRASRPLFYPDWRGLLFTAALIAAGLLFLPDFRAWAYEMLLLPVVADVLGRPELHVAGVTVQAFRQSIQIASAALFVLALVTVRAVILHKQSRGSYWARRIRLDGPFVMALTPFIALGPVIAALESGLLFRAPWVFLAVPPVLFVMIVFLAVVSLLWGLWIEEGGRAHSQVRFLMALLVFLSVDLFWISVVEGTTRRLPLWAPPLALVVAYGVYYGVTLGNRLLSHRRVLFALGFFHLVLLGTFLGTWIVEGAWPAMEWTFEGLAAVRNIGPADPWLALLVLLPPIAITTGFQAFGQFLHRYAFWARPFLDGLNLMLVFALTLEAWAMTVMVVDPFGALAATRPAADPIVAWSVSQLDGWGYFVGRTAFAVAAVVLLDLPFRYRTGPWQEAGHLARGALVALGLVPGLRVTIRLATGL